METAMNYLPQEEGVVLTVLMQEDAAALTKFFSL